MIQLGTGHCHREKRRLGMLWERCLGFWLDGRQCVYGQVPQRPSSPQAYSEAIPAKVAEHLLGVCHLPTARVLGKPIYMSYTSGKMAQNSESREPHLGNWILRTLYSSRHSIVRVLRSLVLPQRTLDSFLWSW